MKKYLSLAAFLGAVAFLSVSYLAQAQSQAGVAATTTTTTTTAPVAAPDAAPAPAADAAMAPLSAYAKDRAECDMLASAASTEGAAPTADAKTAALKKCLIGKGHTEEEIAKEEAALTPPPAGAETTTTTTTTVAPVAPEAPAAK